MQKTIVRISILFMLTLTLTEFAAAAWEENEFTNNSSSDVYVAFSTLRPADAQRNIPEGYRTVGWYRIRAGGSHTFYTQDGEYIYYLIYQGGNYIKPTGAQSFTSWMHTNAFVLVTDEEMYWFDDDIDIEITYTNRDRTTLTENRNFFGSESGGSVTVTNTGVTAPLAELSWDGPEDGTEGLPGAGDTTDDDDDSTDDDDDSTDDDDNSTNTGVNIGISTSSGSTTLNQASTTQLTISVTEAGDAAANRVLALSVSGDKATISPATGTTNSNGELSATLKINNDATAGTFNITAAIANTSHSTTLPITVQVGAGSISISRSASTIEPGQTSTITFTARTPGGDLFSGAQLSLSASVGNISPTLVTTGSNGQGTATYTADQYTSTPHPRTISSPKITATVVNDTSVKNDTTLTVRYVPSSLSVSGAPSSITSGQTATITATVKSRSGKAMRDVSVSFSESSSYLRFSSSSATTNSSGNASSTLRTGGKTSGASFTVSTSGVSSRFYTVQVNPTKISTSKTVTVEGRRIGIWDTNYWYDWERTVSFPGTVASIDSCRSTAPWGSGHVDTCTRSGSSVKVKGQILAKTAPTSTVKTTVSVTYESPASLPAPSLHPQLRPEVDQLSAVWQDLSEIPSEMALLPNYPNPFNPETWIPYHLSDPAEVTLSIYSADGRLVRTLALGHQPAGVYESKSRAAYWDGRNAVGESVASGVYFYTLTADDFTATGKMLIVK